MARIEWGRKAGTGQRYHAMRWTESPEGDVLVRVCSGNEERGAELDVRPTKPVANVCANCLKMLASEEDQAAEPAPSARAPESPPEPPRSAPTPEPPLASVATLHPGRWVSARFLVGGPKVREARAEILAVDPVSHRADLRVPAEPRRPEVRLRAVLLDPDGVVVPSYRLCKRPGES